MVTGAAELVRRTVRGNGSGSEEGVVCGGPARSVLWTQMHADVSNVPVSLTGENEGPVPGSAMLAAVGAGTYPDVHEAGASMVHTRRVIEPNQEAHEGYEFYVERYVETYLRMRGLMHEMSRHEASSNGPETVVGA